MKEITRFGISINTALLDTFDKQITRSGYSNRSEAIRDLVRERLVREEWEEGNEETVGTITLIFDHHKRYLQEELTEHQHKHHDLVLSSMHVHLDHDNCLEVLAVKGPASDLRNLADSLISLKGVKHGKLVMTYGGGEF